MSENRLMSAVAAEFVHWRNPDVEPPPRGVKMLMLTSGGVLVLGCWMDGSNLIAWSPNPKRPPGLVQLPTGYYGWSDVAHRDEASALT